MGITFTPKYTLHIPGTTPMTWRREYGRPTVDNLEKWVFTYATSLEAGGVNNHISKGLGYIPYPSSAFIKRNIPGGEVVATWKAGMFQVYS